MTTATFSPIRFSHRTELPPDDSIELHGFVTDPKLVGYQLLTNYESTYWRPLVGHGAWSLYEILRSFCHEGDNTCFPSINLLLEILDLKQRRILTGWTTTVRGKRYEYPGWIEILQEAKLLIAELREEGGGQRYLFHVNLTPDLLNDEQLARLSPKLQNMHARLLQRVEATQAALEKRRRPPKHPARAQLNPQGIHGSTTNNGAPSSRTNCQSEENQVLPYNSQIPRCLAENIVEVIDVITCEREGDNLSEEGDRLSPKQYPINITQKTTASVTRKNNNSNANAADNDVVVALTKSGIAQSTAQRLATRYSCARIEEKIAFLEFVQEEQPGKITNPCGWLRRAIEENYAAPDGYVSPAEIERRRYEEEERAADETCAWEAQQAAAKAEKAARLHRRRAQNGVTPDDLAFWEAAREDIQYRTTPQVYELVAEAELLQLTKTTLCIGVRSALEQRYLGHPGSLKAIERALARCAGRPLTLQAEVCEV